jgi:hypothetical protein
VSQSGPDEISQGLDRPPFRPPSWLRPRTAVAAASALILGAAVTAAVVLSRPPYPHAWCGPVLAELHVPGQSDLAYAQALARLRHRDHAPVSGLVSELRDYAIARSVLSYSDGLSSGSETGMVSIFGTMQRELRTLNRQCGQPPGAYQQDSF